MDYVVIISGYKGFDGYWVVSGIRMLIIRAFFSGLGGCGVLGFMVGF